MRKLIYTTLMLVTAFTVAAVVVTNQGDEDEFVLAGDSSGPLVVTNEGDEDEAVMAGVAAFKQNGDEDELVQPV